MTAATNHRNFRLYALLGVIFLMLLGTLMAASVALDVRRAEQRFLDNAHFVQSHFEALANRNLIALHGFAALLKIEGPSHREALSSYARDVIATQPHLYMLEVGQKVTREQLPSLRAELEQEGIANFAPKRAEQGRLSLLPDQPDYYPVIFMEPMLPEAQEILGLDLEATPYLQVALRQAIDTGRAVVSAPFPLVEGDTAYMLLKTVETEGKLLLAMVICKARDLMPSPSSRQHDLSIEAAYEGADNRGGDGILIRLSAETVPSTIAQKLLPRLSMTYPSAGPDQPYRLRIERQMDFDIVQYSMLAFITLGGGVTLLVLVEFARAHHRQEMKNLEETNKLFQMANFDPLTGLPNRKLFMNRLEQALAIAHRQGGRHAVLFLDLDGFKGVNDYYGHQIGDRVLQRAARIFQRCVREIDTVSRLGGDEFVILLLDVQGRAKAQQIANKIRKAFGRQTSESSRLLPMIGTSIGIATYPDDGETAAALLDKADQDMYRDKSANKQDRNLTATNRESVVY